MSQKAKTNEAIRAVLDRCSFKEHEFVLLTPRTGELFLQIQYWDPDVITGIPTRQHGRKWRISRFMTTSEISQTAFKAILTSQEHIAREFFTYRNVNVYSPHYDVEQLYELKLSEQALDVRA